MLWSLKMNICSLYKPRPSLLRQWTHSVRCHLTLETNGHARTDIQLSWIAKQFRRCWSVTDADLKQPTLLFPSFICFLPYCLTLFFLSFLCMSPFFLYFFFTFIFPNLFSSCLYFSFLSIFPSFSYLFYFRSISNYLFPSCVFLSFPFFPPFSFVLTFFLLSFHASPFILPSFLFLHSFLLFLFFALYLYFAFFPSLYHWSLPGSFWDADRTCLTL